MLERVREDFGTGLQEHYLRTSTVKAAPSSAIAATCFASIRGAVEERGLSLDGLHRTCTKMFGLGLISSIRLFSGRNNPTICSICSCTSREETQSKLSHDHNPHSSFRSVPQRLTKLTSVCVGGIPRLSVTDSGRIPNPTKVKLTEGISRNFPSNSDFMINLQTSLPPIYFNEF
jgi:hypothetical protein